MSNATHPSFFTPVDKIEESSSHPNFFTPVQKIPEDKGFRKAFRKVYQPVSGALQRITYPLDLVQLASLGEGLSGLDELSPERIEELKKLYPQAPWENAPDVSSPEFREKYLENVASASQAFPTQSNIERLIEDRAGIPLTAEDKTDRNLKLGGFAAASRPGSLVGKLTAGLTAPLLKEGITGLGVPEPIAELGSLAITQSAPGVSNITKEVGESGLIKRRFENVKKPTTIGAKRFSKIQEKTENDFKNLTQPLLEENRTYRAMKENADFKQKVGEIFKQVEEKAAEFSEPIGPEGLRRSYFKQLNSEEMKGFSPSEYEVELAKRRRKIQRRLPKEQITSTDLVDQYRKNNEELGALFEPSKSGAFNQAKRDSLIEYNRAIADVIEEQFPDSEFSNLFKFSNKRWQEINDVEKIEGFFEQMFKDKVNFNKGRLLLENSKKGQAAQRPFRRILGDENFEQFQGVVKDLLSKEQAMKFLRPAKDKGVKDLVGVGLKYMISPYYAESAILTKHSKALLQTMLDKPKFNVTWKSAIDDVKAGRLTEAEKKFKELDGMLKYIPSVVDKSVEQSDDNPK